MAAGRDELNRINVFPVPEGDTGTNMCLTLRAVAAALRNLGDDNASLPLPHVAETMAQASVRGARGNSGMMLSEFLIVFREGIGERFRINARELAAAIGIGFERLSSSLDEPMEGTILTVARETAAEAGRAGGESDLRVFMRRIVHQAEQALQRTPELLAALKKAGVVDAGAKGFVRLLDGVKRLIDEGQIAEGAVDREGAESSNAAAQAEVEADRDYRYCTELMVRSPALPDPAAVRQALRSHGGSIVVLATGDLLKAHVHTDAPDAVFQLASTWGTLESTKADDMRAQHQALQARRPVALITDTACDLPDELVLQYDIGLVPMQLIVDEHSYRDRLELTAAEFFRRMRAGLDASTSQPAPQAFGDAYQDAARAGDHVIAVTVSSGLSGTHANAVAAAKRFDPEGGRVTVVDSRTASLGQGLLVVRGVELAAAGWQPRAIVGELERVRAQSGGVFTVDNFERLVRSGRVGRGRAWLGTKLNLKPVMGLTIEGKIEPVGRARGREGARKRLLELLDRALTPRPRALRLGVVHGDVPELAEALRVELVARYRPIQCLVSPITPVIAAHAGIGAWGVFYQNEDGTKAEAGRYD